MAHSKTYSPSICDWYDIIISGGYGEYSENSYSTALRNILKDKAKNTIELGIGTGRFAEELINLGYSVTGLDSCKEMVAKAKSRLGDSVKLVNKNVLDLDIQQDFDHKFDAAYSMGGVWYMTNGPKEEPLLVSHIRDLKENEVGLKKIWDSLAPDGYLILNVQEPHTDLGFEIKDNIAYSQKVSIDLNKSLISKKYYVKSFDDNITHAFQNWNYRIFRPKERKELMKSIGFKEKGFDPTGKFMIYRKSLIKFFLF